MVRAADVERQHDGLAALRPGPHQEPPTNAWAILHDPPLRRLSWCRPTHSGTTSVSAYESPVARASLRIDDDLVAPLRRGQRPTFFR